VAGARGAVEAIDLDTTRGVSGKPLGVIALGGDTRCASSAALAPAERRGSKALAPPETLKTKSKPYP